MTDTKDYEVGYKKPPKQHQFKKGEPSGNPRGRRKKSRNFTVLVNRTLKENVVIIKDGVKKKMTAQEVIVQNLISRAMKGDLKAIERVIKFVPEQSPEQLKKNFEQGMEQALDEMSEEKLDELIRMLKQFSQNPPEY